MTESSGFAIEKPTTAAVSPNGISADRLEEISKDCLTPVAERGARAAIKGLSTGFVMSLVAGTKIGIPVGVVMALDKFLYSPNEESNACQVRKIEKELGKKSD